MQTTETNESDEGAVSHETTNPPPPPGAPRELADTERSTSGPAEPERSQPERSRLYRRMHANPALALASKVVVAVVGGAVLVAGVIMMVTPGPALVLIPLGLAILASEFAWARRWLEKAREQARKAKERAEAMDPKVRRRRLLLIGAAVVVVVGLVVGYVALYDWPSYAVHGWNWVQGLSAWVPELPGM